MGTEIQNCSTARVQVHKDSTGHHNQESSIKTNKTNKQQLYKCNQNINMAIVDKMQDPL